MGYPLKLGQLGVYGYAHALCFISVFRNPTSNGQKSVEDFENVGAPRLLHDRHLIHVHGDGGEASMLAVCPMPRPRLGADAVVVVPGVLQPHQGQLVLLLLVVGVGGGARAGRVAAVGMAGAGERGGGGAGGGRGDALVALTLLLWRGEVAVRYVDVADSTGVPVKQKMEENRLLLCALKRCKQVKI